MQLHLDKQPILEINAVFVVAYDSDKNNTFAGRIAFGSERNNFRFGKISDFFVAKRYRGKGGAASVLMNYAETQLIQRGFKRAALTVSTRNQHAQEFYERRGWQKASGAIARGRLLRYEKDLTQEHG